MPLNSAAVAGLPDSASLMFAAAETPLPSCRLTLEFRFPDARLALRFGLPELAPAVRAPLPRRARGGGFPLPGRAPARAESLPSFALLNSPPGQPRFGGASRSTLRCGSMPANSRSRASGAKFWRSNYDLRAPRRLRSARNDRLMQSMSSSLSTGLAALSAMTSRWMVSRRSRYPSRDEFSRMKRETSSRIRRIVAVDLGRRSAPSRQDATADADRNCSAARTNRLHCVTRPARPRLSTTMTAQPTAIASIADRALAKTRS